MRFGPPPRMTTFGRLPGVDRPALAVQMVTETGPFVLLDIGANMDSSGNNLYQFAHMGSIYAERVLGVQKPRVALLSIGEEPTKGTQAVIEAHRLMAADPAPCCVKYRIRPWTASRTRCPGRPRGRSWRSST